MQVYGIGTDIIEIDRFNQSDGRFEEKFMLRCFTEQEREHLSKRRLESVAGYFAAKEAVAKALGTGFAGFMPASIEIRCNPEGKPEVFLHNEAAKIAKRAGITKIDISISHCETLAVAMAVAQI
ncbi:MAG: holo-ACP synthase [Defluviitaleaceae bacterium]|nr:holo-ACP synthase [Defluviitaleaceae bacterium]